MADISITLPSAALHQISGWADASGLASAEFYSTALITGARLIASSVAPGFIASLTPEQREYVSAAANTSVTADVLLQIVLGGEAQADLMDQEQPSAELVVSLDDELCGQFCEAADGIGMGHDKFYALAFVTGARLAASTLDHSSLFPLELLVQSTRRSVTPEMLMRAMMRRNRKGKPRRPPDTGP